MKTLAASATFALIVLAACTGREPSASGPRPIGVGEVAPAFTLPSADGGTVSSSDFVGKPVLLYFSMGPG